MRKHIYLFLLAIFTLYPLGIQAQTLWQKSEYGMTAEQVKKLFPDAVHPKETFINEEGEAELLELNEITIVDEPFHVSFLFKDGGLTRVTLLLEGKKKFSEAFYVFEKLTKALRAKYGSELTSKVERGFLNLAKSSWLSHKTNIELTAMGVEAAGAAALFLNYGVKLSAEVDKL
ncbi:MAG: hypothetical protein KJ717_03955 [Proteobacteria bacterium]|nr:hypothetical protein [Pseudomonadota bacterium]